MLTTKRLTTKVNFDFKVLERRRWELKGLLEPIYIIPVI